MGLVIMLVLSSSLIAASAEKTKTPKEQATEMFQTGKKAMLVGDYKSAITSLNKAVAIDKTRTSYRLYLARAYHYSGKTKETITQLTEIMKTTPDHVEAGQLLGQVYTKGKEWKKVITVMSPLLKYRHDYTTYHLLANAQYNLKELTKAKKNYIEAIKLNSKNAEDHYRLANIYLGANSFSRAANSYNKAMALGMEGPTLRYKLGSAYFNLRNYFGRVSVASIKSGKAGTISNKFYLIEAVPGKKDLFRVAPEQSAIYQVTRAIEDGIKDRADIRFLKANIYLNAHRYQTAYGMFAKIRKAIPKEDKSLFFFYYAEAAFGLGKYDEYISLLKEAVKIDKETYGPSMVEAYIKVADRANQDGKFSDYIKYLELAMKASPQTATLHLKLAYAYEETREYKKAILQWRMVLDLVPNHPSRTNLLNSISKYNQIIAAKKTKKPSN